MQPKRLDICRSRVEKTSWEKLFNLRYVLNIFSVLIFYANASSLFPFPFEILLDIRKCWHVINRWLSSGEVLPNTAKKSKNEAN